MSLVSFQFILFISVGCIIFYLVPKKTQWLVLLILSYLFYLCGGMGMVGYILVTTVTVWMTAILLENSDKSMKARIKQGADILTKEAVCLKASCGAGHLDSIFRGLARIDLEKPAPSFEPIREQLEEMEDRESLCTIFFSADARPEFQQLLEKFKEEKREFIWFCPVNRVIRPEINAGIRPYTRLIDVEEGGRL